MTVHRLYVGSYTQALPHVPQAQGEGIYACTFDSTSGVLTWLGLAASAANPSYLAAHPAGHTVYAVSEVEPGMLNAYRTDSSGRSAPGRAPGSGRH